MDDALLRLNKVVTQVYRALFVILIEQYIVNIIRMRASRKDVRKDVGDVMKEFQIFVYITIREKHWISVGCCRLGHR